MANILSQAEVDALLGAMEADAGGRERQLVTPHDFRRPNRTFIKEQMRFFRSTHETFARQYASSLSGYLRSLVEIDLLTIDHLAYSDYIHSLPKSTSLFTFELNPLEGRGVLEISPSLILVMIDRLFGGTGGSSEIDRDLTNIESAVTTKLVQRGFRLLQEAWSAVVDLDIEMGEQVSCPHALQAMSENEPVVMITFELRVRESSGTFSLCYPYLSTEPILAGITRSRTLRVRSGRPEGAEGPRWIRMRVEESALEVVVELGGAELTVAEFLNLREGDVIRLERGIEEAADIRIGGEVKAKARPGLCGRRRAVRIDRMERQGGQEDES